MWQIKLLPLLLAGRTSVTITTECRLSSIFHRHTGQLNERAADIAILYLYEVLVEFLSINS